MKVFVSVVLVSSKSPSQIRCSALLMIHRPVLVSGSLEKFNHIENVSR